MKHHMLAALVTGASVVAFPALAEEIAIALHVEPDNAMFQVAERIEETIEERSDGRYDVTLLGSEVGGERDQIEATSVGEYDIVLGGSIPMSLYAPQYAASDLPFVFDSSEEARRIYEGEIGEKIQEAFSTNGNLRLIGLSIRNPRNLTSKFPVETPEDIQDVPIRVPQIESWVDIWSEIGALPSPIAWPEVYTALQTGVIEMQENPVGNIYSGRLYEVQDYINRTEHVHSFYHWLMNEDFYESLSEEDREMIQTAIDEAIAWGDELVVGNEQALYEKLKEEGMEVVEPDVAAFREAAAPAIRRVAEGFAPEVREYVLSNLE